MTHYDVFEALHRRPGVFVIPNPWDVGSAKILESLGYEALATTSSGFAASLGRNDGRVTRGELLAHVRALSGAVAVPLHVDAERGFGESPADVADTVAMVAEAGAAGVSIEDWNPAARSIDPVPQAVERVAAAAAAAHTGARRLVLTARCENHIHGVTDLADTIARLTAYEQAGADCVFAPGVYTAAEVRSILAEVSVPLNVLAWRGGMTVAELGELGVKRVSLGGNLAFAAYGALVSAAEHIRATGDVQPAQGTMTRQARDAAFGVD